MVKVKRELTPPGLLDEYIQCATSIGGAIDDETIELDELSPCYKALALKRMRLAPMQQPTADAWTPTRRSRGLGDTVAKAAAAFGIKPCEGCKKRQALLNRAVPYSNDAG